MDRERKAEERPLPVEPHENWITDRLAGRILNEPLFRGLPFVVDAQKRLLDIEGNEPGRIDLCFRHRHSHRAYFAFEAKRLHVTYPGGSSSSEYSTYTSNQGMEAYVIGQYSGGFPAAGMLAYVMDGRTLDAWTGLNASIATRRSALRISADGKLDLAQMPRLNEKDTASGILLGETIHHLENSSLQLIHLLLPYPNCFDPV